MRSTRPARPPSRRRSATADSWARSSLTHRVEVTFGGAHRGHRARLGGRPALQVRRHENFTGGQFATGVAATGYMPWREGDDYSSPQLLDLQQRLVGADYFSTVTVQPHPEKAVDRVVPVDVELTPAKRNIYSAALYASTDRGVGVDFSAQRRWLNDKGHKGQAEFDLAQRLKAVELSYRIPLPGRPPAHAELRGYLPRRGNRIEHLANRKAGRERGAQVERLHHRLWIAVPRRRFRDRQRRRQFHVAVLRGRDHALALGSTRIRAARLQLYADGAWHARRSAHRHALRVAGPGSEMAARLRRGHAAHPARRSGGHEGR